MVKPSDWTTPRYDCAVEARQIMHEQCEHDLLYRNCETCLALRLQSIAEHVASEYQELLQDAVLILEQGFDRQEMEREEARKAREAALANLKRSDFTKDTKGETDA